MRAQTRGTMRTDVFRLGPRDWVPNNARLPVVVYRDVLDSQTIADGDRLASTFEAMFQRNGWPPKWRNGIFDYHHFHSSAHEVLGIAAGIAQVIVGGPGGRVVHLEAGDVILLPAGTGHCLMSSSGPLDVVGAYPPNQQWDIRRDALTPKEQRAMQALPFPPRDPIYGEHGPMTEYWHAQR